MQPKIAAIVMTSEEAENIGKCLASLRDLDTVIVLDCHSTDGTAAIAERFANAKVVPVEWQGYARTFNSGLPMAAGHDWVLRIDADEELVGDIRAAVAAAAPPTAGLVLRREVYFLGERLRFGPHAKLRILRLFRAGSGRCEDVSADEHIVVDGEVRFEPRIHLIDRDQKPGSRWIAKHVHRAKLQAADACRGRAGADPGRLDAFNRGKRLMKYSVYYRLPPFLRAFLYFGFRFFVQLECLGGRANVIWCVMQGLWFRLLVDFYIVHPDLIDEP